MDEGSRIQQIRARHATQCTTSVIGSPMIEGDVNCEDYPVKFLLGSIA